MPRGPADRPARLETGIGMRAGKIGKIIRNAAVVLLAAMAAAALALVLTVNATPNALVWYLRHNSSLNGTVEVAAQVEAAASQVNIRANVPYPSRYPDHTLDVYSPVDGHAHPTLFWVHGGGFISGDKAGVRSFAMEMAQNGYTVVALNYAVAPETNYPAPVVQVGEAYEYIRAHSSDFPSADLSRAAFGGDSAGAQIASQFVAVQTNAALAAEMKMSAVVPASSLKAAVLYCGPYNLAAFRHVKGVAGLFVQQVGWAYFGRRDWLGSRVADQVSTYDFVTKEYPPTFLTDGNSGSFEPQGQALFQKLESLGVPADALFYPAAAGAVPHEYQFDYIKYGQKAAECFDRTLRFLALHMPA